MWVRYVRDFISMLFKCISHRFSTLHDSILAQMNCYCFLSCTCRLIACFLAPNMTILTCFEVSYALLLGEYVCNLLTCNLIFVWNISCAEHCLCDIGVLPPNINRIVCVIIFVISSFSFILSCFLQSLFTVYKYH